jgi:hypothetical protein
VATNGGREPFTAPRVSCWTQTQQTCFPRHRVPARPRPRRQRAQYGIETQLAPHPLRPQSRCSQQTDTKAGSKQQETGMMRRTAQGRRSRVLRNALLLLRQSHLACLYLFLLEELAWQPSDAPTASTAGFTRPHSSSAPSGENRTLHTARGRRRSTSCATRGSTPHSNGHHFNESGCAAWPLHARLTAVASTDINRLPPQPRG